MLAKILILFAICAAVYLVTQRHRLFPGIFDGKSGRRNDDGALDAIDELDYDPKTGHYRVKDRKKDKK